jgi:hypothetical protein
MVGVSGSAFGQLSLVDQNRSLTANATGSFGSQQPTLSDSSTAAGGYSNALTASKTDTFVDTFQNTYTYKVNSNASQNSIVSALLLSGTGSGGAGASFMESTQGSSAEALGQSIYNVDFSVSSPTLLTLTGDITGSGEYHLGPLEVVKANVTLSSSGQGTPLYSVSDTLNIPIGTGTATFNDPVLFSTTLEPGVTYTLNAQAYSDSVRSGSVGINQYAPADATFSFSASVPEPVGMALLLPVIASLSRSRRRAL